MTTIGFEKPQYVLPLSRPQPLRAANRRRIGFLSAVRVPQKSGN